MLDQLGQLSGIAQAFPELEASDEPAALTHAPRGACIRRQSDFY